MFCKRKLSISDMLRTMAIANYLDKAEQKDIERAFARLFASEDGRKVLAWLQVTTFHRAAPAIATEAQLRFNEGQRSLVGTILRMADRGRAH